MCFVLKNTPRYSKCNDFTLQQLEQMISQSFKNGLVSQEGVFILEHSKHTDVSGFERFSESRRYGGSVFSFFQ